MNRRAFVVVIDACGAGELPDAAEYGDAGANTLAHLAEAVGGLDLPVLGSLGLGNILALEGVPAVEHPSLHGRLRPLGPGKDSSTGHWELMGVSVATAPPTFPDGIPEGILGLVAEIFGARSICNRAYDGVAAIDDFGSEHLASGGPILYTSQDSVLQLAAHIGVFDELALHAACERLRARLSGPDAVRRVIARPFEGAPGAFERTLGRRDYTLPPPAQSHLSLLAQAGVEVHGVGKVAALFESDSFSAEHPGATNVEAIESVGRLIGELDAGFVFANLIETDQRYGHRHDVEGFHDALRQIDAALAGWLDVLEERDLLIITADHGCDPAAPHTDHTREHAPLLARFTGHGGRRHDGPMADVGSSVLDWLTGAERSGLPGRSFISSDA
ncbi:MAG TPA: phosphopentomutase [Solirubrobacteraceae bacterium]|nr:phosphopentomutase [Solirubrobacteraceae bacterium]